MRGVLGAVGAMAGSYTSPFLLDGRTLFGPKKHAAAVRYRTLQYDRACSCFQYVGPARPLPQP